MRVFVTGESRFVGVAAGARLLGAGHHITELARPQPCGPGLPGDLVRGRFFTQAQR